MKRYDLLLAAIGAAAVGLIAGYFLGQIGAAPLDPRSTASAQPLQSTSANGGELSIPDGVLAVGPRGDWLRERVAEFGHAVEGQPTPGLAEAFRQATLSEPPFDQARMISLIEMLRKEDFPATLEIMRKLKTSHGVPGSTGQPMWLAFWRRFGELDPEKALSMVIASVPLNLPNQDEAEKQVFNGLARINPVTAAETFLAHPELSNRDAAVRGIIAVWMKKDPRAALAWAQTLEPALQPDAYYSAAWGATNRYDISAGTALLKEVPTDEARKNVARGLKVMLGTRPYVPANQVLSLVETLRQTTPPDKNFEQQMAVRIAKEDPYAAANFFSRPPANVENWAPGPELSGVANVWAQSDPKAAENWLKGKEETPAYLIFAAAFAQAAQQRGDPAEFQRWQAKLPPAPPQPEGVIFSEFEQNQAVELFEMKIRAGKERAAQRERAVRDSLPGQ